MLTFRKRYARECYGLQHALLLARIFTDLSNRQIKVLAKFSRYTVLSSPVMKSTHLSVWETCGYPADRVINKPTTCTGAQHCGLTPNCMA